MIRTGKCDSRTSELLVRQLLLLIALAAMAGPASAQQPSGNAPSNISQQSSQDAFSGPDEPVNRLQQIQVRRVEEA